MTRFRKWVIERPIGLFTFSTIGAALIVMALVAGAHTANADPTAGECPAGTPSIVALEFAGDGGAAQTIVDAWSKCAGQSVEEATAAAKEALERDSLLLIPSYVVTLLWWALHGCWASQRSRVRRIGRYLMYGIGAAGVLDLVENVFLSRVVDGQYADARWATAATFPKWTILGIAIPFAIAAVVAANTRWIRHLLMGEAERPEFVGRLSRTEGTVAPPLVPTTPEPLRQARRLVQPEERPWPDDAIGICVSGGGIRAASFALGALQAMQESTLDGTDASPSIYASADYLATVSGGGYTATATQLLAHQRPNATPPPFAAGTAEAEMLAKERRYLWADPAERDRWLQSTREFVTGMTFAALGIAFNVTVVIGAIFVATHPLGWFAREVVFAHGTRRLNAGLVLGAIAAGLAVLAIMRPFLVTQKPRQHIAVAWMLAVAEVGFGVAALLLILSRGFPGTFVIWLAPLGAGLARALILRVWPRRSGRGLLEMAKVAAGWLLLAYLVVVAWYWTDLGFERGRTGRVSWFAIGAVRNVAIFLTVAVVIGAALRLAVARPRMQTGVGAIATLWLVGGAAAAMGASLFVTNWIAGVIGPPSRRVTSDFRMWLGIAIALGLVYVFLDQKRWSLHPVYKARLARAFGWTRNADGKAERMPYRTVTTLSEWAKKPAGSPKLLVCAAAYDNCERREGEPSAWPFVFSADYVGSHDVGWRRTVDFEAGLGRWNQTDGTLQAAMAISGAAVSPAIGTTNLGAANAFVAGLNLRLGVWLPNPRYIAALQAAPRFPPSWIRTRRFTYLFKEIIGSYDLDDRFVYVTDGGELDNLGLTELLSRRCKLIFCFDASGDLKPERDLNTNTFDGVRDLAWRRLGVRFSLPGKRPDGAGADLADGHRVRFGYLTRKMVTPAPEATVRRKWNAGDAPLPRVAVAQDNVTILDIHYPGDAGPSGTLVYGKCVLTPTSSRQVVDFALSTPGRQRFPSDSTVDQWLERTQFDAYVALGYQVGLRAAAQLPP